MIKPGRYDLTVAAICLLGALTVGATAIAVLLAAKLRREQGLSSGLLGRDSVASLRWRGSDGSASQRASSSPRGCCSWCSLGACLPDCSRTLRASCPACVTTARRLRGDPRVPRRVKLVVAGAGLWVLSPIDLIPEFLPVIGPLDDVVIVALALRYAARRIPRAALDEAWPAEQRILDRLIGRQRIDPGDGGADA